MYGMNHTSNCQYFCLHPFSNTNDEANMGCGCVDLLVGLSNHNTRIINKNAEANQKHTTEQETSKRVRHIVPCHLHQKVS
jgi:hypothetical protein